MFCLFCKSSARNRHVAKMLLNTIARSTASSLENAVEFQNIRVHNTNGDDALTAALYKHMSYAGPEFLRGIKPGCDWKERVSCQDVESLSFPRKSLDVIISEDVFEHVRDYKRGLLEFHRVLKPGGYHIFTVPMLFDRETLVRIDTSGRTDVHILPPEYHGGPRVGKIISYRTFGRDLLDLLRSMSFGTKTEYSDRNDRRNGIYDSYVFI